MIKKHFFSLLLLVGATLGLGSCGGSGSTESSDIQAGDLLTFVMESAHGTIKIAAVGPTSGFVTYLGVPALVGSSQITSNQAISFYYRPSESFFSIDFRVGNDWHIDPGPVIISYSMNCSFKATLEPTWEANSQKNGTMTYSFDRWVYNDPHNDVAEGELSIGVSNVKGTYGIQYSGSTSL